MGYLPDPLIDHKIEDYLLEDMPFGDLTAAFVPNKDVAGTIIGKEKCIVAGIPFAHRVFQHLGLDTHQYVAEGAKIDVDQRIFTAKIDVDQRIFTVKGNARAVLAGERLALNFLIRLSGIATLTHQLIQASSSLPKGPRIAATRKTTPGFRFFEKYAVIIGGGDTHRLSLSDGVLLKENHLSIFSDLTTAIQYAKKQVSFTKKIEIEVTTIEMAVNAAQEGADIIMLDNFEPTQIRKVVDRLSEMGLRANVCLEASGGINSENVIEFASTGVDILSVGSLTHSAKGIDFSLVFEPFLEED
ncbi:MAG: carboxylating nicotinate-nucleotide diphosphorylase [Candidatus Hodarchaeales archaeon]